MIGYESWIIKTECQRIDAFELRCWRRLLRVLWTARRSSQSILKKINPKYSLEGLMLMLKLQYFGHLMWRINSLETILMLGKIEGKRRREWQRMRWLDSISDSMDMNLSKVQEREEAGEPGRLQSMESQELRRSLATKWQQQIPFNYKYKQQFTVELPVPMSLSPTESAEFFSHNTIIVIDISICHKLVAVSKLQ